MRCEGARHEPASPPTERAGMQPHPRLPSFSPAACLVHARRNVHAPHVKRVQAAVLVGGCAQRAGRESGRAPAPPPCLRAPRPLPLPRSTCPPHSHTCEVECFHGVPCQRVGPRLHDQLAQRRGGAQIVQSQPPVAASGGKDVGLGGVEAHAACGGGQGGRVGCAGAALQKRQGRREEQQQQEGCGRRASVWPPRAREHAW